MNKSSKNAGHRHSLRDRILAHIMIVLITITMLPYQSLAVRAASTQTVKSVGGVKTEYEVDNGTSKDDIGLPSSLSAVIETTTAVEGATNGETTTSEETVDKSVSWEGNYDGNAAGTYALTAKFDDSSLSYDNMPTVHVTVREKETTSEGASNEAGKTEDAEDGDDDGESDQPAQSEEEPVQKDEDETVKEEAEEEAAEETSKPEAEDAEEEVEEEVVEKNTKTAFRNNNGSYSDDFEDFIHDGDTHVVITDPDGNVKENHYAEPGDTIEVNYTFKELPTTGSLQMWIADDFTVVPINLHTMTLDLPEEIDWSRISPVNYQLSFRDPVSQQTYTMDATATINGNTVEFNWDADPSDDSEHGDIYKLMRLSEMGDMVISLSIYGTITEDTDKIELPGDIVIPVDNTSKIRVGKYFTPAAVETIVKADDSLKEDTKFSVQLMVATVDPDGDYVRDANHHIVYHSETVTFTYKNILEGTGALYEIAGVKAGTYTVKETAVPSVSGYDFLNVNGTSTTLPAEHSITVDNGDVKEVSFTNNYEKRVGKIVVKKLIDGDLTADKLTPGQKAGMTFKVTKEGSSSSIANFSFDQFTHNSDGTYTYTISDLDEGNYVVTETITAAGEVPGFTRTTTYAVETGHGSADSDKAKPIVSNHHDTLVTVTNSYTQKYGDLKISKTLDKTEAPGLTDALTDGITFTVTAGGENVNFVKTSSGAYHYVKKVVDGGTTKYVSTVDGTEYAESAVIHSVTYGDIKSSGEFTILGLPCGVNYTVTESNMMFGDHGFIRTTKVSVNGGNATTANSGTTTAVDDATHSIAFSNTYSMGAKLKVTKTIDPTGDLTSLTTAQKNAMKFTLYKKLGDTPNPDTDTKIGERTLTQLGNGYTWSGLDFGDYYVVESGQEIANYNSTTTATITEYTLKPDGSTETHTSTSTGLRAEASVGEAGYDHPSVIAFKNKYLRERGTLQIAKTLDTTGIAAEDLESVKEAIVFSINRTAPSAATYDTFTYKDLEDAYNSADKTIVIYHNADHSGTAYYGKVSFSNGTYKVVFDGDESIDGNHSLPTGTYVITEAGDYTGYSLTTHVATGKDAADQTDDFGKSATVSFADGETAKAAFSNAYKPSGLLKISKTWGPTLTQAEYDKMQQAMRFIVRDSEGNIVYKRDAQGQPTTDYLFTYDELTGPGVVVEAGKTYTVEEVAEYVDVDGYTRTTEIINTVNIDTESPEPTDKKTIVAIPGDGSQTISDPSVVNKGHTTEFAFYNRYAGGVGPGAGAYIYKNYSGLESGQYPGNPERDVIHARIILKFTHYVSATDKTPISEFCIPLAEAVEQGGIRLAEGGYYEIEELGRYTVTQDAHGNDVYTEDPNGEYSAIATDMYYDWNCKVKVGDSALMSDAPAKLTVPANGFVGITFTNNYTPYGALKVTKDFTGLTAAQINNLKSKITFAVSRFVNGGWETVETFTLSSANVVKVSDTSYYRLMTHLPVGEYKVVETISGEVTNYTRTSYVTVTTKLPEGGTSATTVSTDSENDPANVVRGGAEADTTVPYPTGGTPDPLTVAFDNDYSQDKGDLIIEKAFGGDHDKLTPEQKAGITFTVFNGNTQVKWNDVEGTYVYDPNGSISSFTFADMTDGKYTITQLPIATYTVKEENYQFDGFSVTATWSGGTNNTIAVVKNTTKTLKVTNTYKEFGKLLITKEFNPATAGTTTEGKAVSFTVYETNPDGTIKTDTSGNPVVAKDINNQPVTFTFDQMTSGSKSVDIAPGTYIVKEDGQDFSTENYVFVSATANGNAYDEENGVQAAVVRYAADDDNKTEVAFVNNYAESGSLKLIKTLNLPSDLDRTPEELQAMYNAIKFTIKNAEGNTVKWNDVSGRHVYAANGSISEVKYADMPSTGYVIEDLPAGDYDVTETIDGESAGAFDPSNPFHGLHRTTTYKINNGAVVNNETTAEDVPVVAAGTTVTFTNTYTKEDPVVVVKGGGKEPAGYVRLDDSGNVVEDGGTLFPYWQFQLTVSDIMDDLDITDTFDVSENNKASEWFRFVTSDETDLLGAFGVTEDSNVNEKIETVSGPAPTVTIDTATAGKAIFHITDTDESQKSKIVITYFLIAKDKDAVIAMNENDGISEEVHWTFTNEAAYLPYPDATEPVTSTVDYTYTCQGADKDYDAEKTIVVRDMQGEARIYELDDEGNPTESVRVSYKVTLNPSAQQLGTEEYLEAYDTLSDGLTLIESTVHVEPSNLGVTWKPCDCEDHAHTLHFEHIPNATTVTITYTAVFDHGGLQTFGNTIQFDTYLKVKTDTAHVTEEGQSGGHLSALNLYKYDEGDHSSRLGGAEFTLFDDTTDQKLTTYVTDQNGYVLLYYYDDAHEHNINFGLPYHIEETKAPVGYEIPEDKNAVYFIIDSSKAGQTITIDGITYIYYASESELTMDDTPFDTEVQLGALKSLLGKTLEEGKFTFSLTAEDGAPSPSETSNTVTATNGSDGKAVFDAITFDSGDLTPIKNDDGIVTDLKDTDFYYTVKEVPGTDPGITYDDTEYTIKVTVGLNSDNTDLVVKSVVIVHDDGDDEVLDADHNVYFTDFENEYNAEGHLVLGAKKTIKGRKLRVEEFTFEAALNDADNTVVSAMNAEGNVYNCDIVFPQIDYVLDEGEGDYKDTTKVVVDGDKYTVYIDPDVLNKTDGDGHRYVDYQYTIKEARNNPPQGVTMDETEYDVTVRVTDLDDGELQIKVLKNGNIITDFFSNFTFINVYKAEGQAKPEGKKFVENDEQELEAGTYEFNVYDITEGEELLGTVTHNASSTGSAGAAIQFPTIKAVVKPTATDDEVGMKVATSNDHVSTITITYRNLEEFEGKEFKFKFDELHGGDVIDGIQYSDVSYEVTATVTLNENDESVLDVNLSKTKELDFTNTPMEAEGEATPKGTKVLNGRKLKEGEFTFDLYYGTKVIGHVTNEAGGKIKYPTIKFVLDASGTEGVTVDSETDTTLVTITVRSPQKLKGPYEFTVMENKDNPSPGIVYPLYPEDRKTFTATAKMKEGSNTEIEVKLTDADALSFVNTYGAAGEETAEGKKVLEGRDLEAKEFWFGILDANNSEIGRVTNDRNGKIQYPTFRYVVNPNGTPGRETETANGALTKVTITVKNVEDLAATEYTVYEIEESEDGITYDTSTRQKITVTPSVNPTDASKLIVSVEAEKGKVFTNTFEAAGQAKPSGYKELTNRLPVEEDEFQFEIKEGDAHIATVGLTDTLSDDHKKTQIDYPVFKYTVDANKDAGTTYDEDSNTIIVNVQAVEDIASPYKYTVKEVIPAGAEHTTDGQYIYNGVTYDQTVIDLTVNVEVNQNDNSRLDVTINKSTGNDFVNDYEAQGAMELTAEKTLLGRILNSGDFTFELRDEKGNVLQTKSNVKNTITFDRITYTLDNMDRDEYGYVKDTVYKYTVNEVKGSAGGVTYDESVYGIKVTLHDNKDGTINVKVEDEFGSLIEAILAKFKFTNAFKNFYDAVGVGTFEGHKTLRGREIKEGDEETVFTFKITTYTGEEFTLTNVGSQIPYPKLKYVVDSSLAPGTVIDPTWDQNENAIVMRAADLENIIDVDNPDADPVVYLPKEYTYTVTEVAGSAAGITYSTQEYTVTATVSLNASDNGKLDVDVKTDPEGDVDFINTYRAEGEATDEAVKYLYGRVLQGQEFRFELSDEKGTVIGTVGNESTGVINYPVFRYVVDPDATSFGLTTTEDANGHLTEVLKTYKSKEDLEKDLTAVYKVKELDDNEIGITYDSTTIDTIKVSVEVTKDELKPGVAKLNVTATTDPAAEFTNYYKALGEKKISGYKHLTYRLPVDKEFEFVIYAVSRDDDVKANKEICRVKSTTMLNADEDAVAINYPTFRYIVDYTAEPGTVYDAENNVIIVTVNWVEELQDDFKYLITEVDDGKDYFTYDTTEITLDVHVTPTGEEIAENVEKLNVAIEDSDGNDFYNEYHAEGALQLYAEKTLLGRILNRDDFTFTLNRTDETFENVIEELDTKTNTKDGSITFDLIEYDLDSMDKDEHDFVVDTNYYYTVSEVVPAGAVENEDGTYTYNGVTYDLNVFNITATLHDNKEGLIEVTLKAEPDGELTFDALLKKYSFKFGNAFVNFYHAEGENTVTGTKMLRGRELKEGEYQFTIKDADGNVLATVSNKADGTINYPVFRYVVNHLADGTSYVYDEENNTLTLTTNNLEDMVTPVIPSGDAAVDDNGEPVEEATDLVTYEPKDYIYTVDEVIPEGAVDNGDGTYTYKGVTYNELGVNYTLTVTVEVNANDMGILDVTIDNPEGLDFSNVYRAKGEDTVVGKKTIKNANIEDFEGKFQFTVSDSEGNLITTVSTDKEGNILYPTFRYVVDPDAEAGAVYDEEANVYTVTVNAYEDLAEVYKYNVTEVEPETEEKDETLSNVAFNTGEITEYEISVTVVANDEDASILDVVALPNTEVDFVNTFYHKAGLYKVSENSGEALKGAVIRLVRVDDDTIIDEWTSDGAVHMINLIEIGEGTFRFVEVKSPSGYHLAKSIEFTQDKDGVLTSSYDHIYDKDGNAIFVMYDPKDANTGDSAPIAAAGGAFAVGLAGLAAVLAQRKKRRA